MSIGALLVLTAVGLMHGGNGPSAHIRHRGCSVPFGDREKQGGATFSRVTISQPLG